MLYEGSSEIMCPQISILKLTMLFVLNFAKPADSIKFTLGIPLFLFNFNVNRGKTQKFSDNSLQHSSYFQVGSSNTASHPQPSSPVCHSEVEYVIIFSEIMSI